MAHLHPLWRKLHRPEPATHAGAPQQIPPPAGHGRRGLSLADMPFVHQVSSCQLCTTWFLFPAPTLVRILGRPPLTCNSNLRLRHWSPYPRPHRHRHALHQLRENEGVAFKSADLGGFNVQTMQRRLADETPRSNDASLTPRLQTQMVASMPNTYGRDVQGRLL